MFKPARLLYQSVAGKYQDISLFFFEEFSSMPFDFVFCLLKIETVYAKFWHKALALRLICSH